MQNQGLRNILFIGAGYVGALSAITMAVQNPNVKFVVYDINQRLIQQWNQSKKLPFFEPRLVDFLTKARQNRNIEFKSSDFSEIVEKSDAIFICVNTPPMVTDSSSLGQETDLRAFKSVVTSLGQVLQSTKIIVNKSTVPIGTSELTTEILKGHGVSAVVVSMPEFLAEGQAIENLINPDRVVIGVPKSPDGERAFDLLKALLPEKVKVINAQNASSELGKLLSNAMLAQRISSINSITSLTEKFVGCDVHEVKSIVSQDTRIGTKYLNPSPGFGGSCFEKDLLSLIHILDQNGDKAAALYWQGVLDINYQQKHRLAVKVTERLRKGSKVAVFGFAYKKNTSDTRLSQSAYMINHLQKEGMLVSIHDPKVTEEGFRVEMEAQGYDEDKENEVNSLEFCGDNHLKAVQGADTIVVMTEWDQFKKYDYSAIRAQMNESAEFYDLRAFLDLKRIKEAGFEAFKLGSGYV